MLENGPAERSGRMALGAVRPIIRLVNLRRLGFGMARHTCLRCTREDIVDMARIAVYVDVFTRQLERGAIVVELAAAKRIGRVALSAVGAIAGFVNLRRFWFGMARHTGLRYSLVVVTGMARSAAGTDVLAGELERSAVMIEARHVGHGSMRALVFGMTVPAASAVGQCAMQRHLTVDLFANIRMAGHAPVGHALAAPRRGVASRTFAADFGVRRNAPELRISSVLPVEFAGGEHAAAGDENARNDDSERCQGGDFSRSQATNALHCGAYHFKRVE